MTLPERLQDLRKKNEDSQEQLADKLNVSRQAVSKWESGQGSPDLNNIVKISEVYNVSTDYILKGTPMAQPAPSIKEPMDASVKKALTTILVFAGITLVGLGFFVGLIFISRIV